MNTSDFTPEPAYEVEPPRTDRWRKIIGFILTSLVIGVSVLLLYVHSLNQPLPFTEPIAVSVNPGDSIPAITKKLESAGIVKSKEWLYLVLVTRFDPTQIKASTYVFSKPLTTYQVAERLMGGDFDTNLQSLTVIEGESRAKIAARLSEQFAWFNSAEFLSLTENKEGHLFPDTYFVPDTFSTAELVTLLLETSTAVVAEYEEEIERSGFTADEVIILASIIEREANTPESMATVASIFNNRLTIGMPLQADASIEYVLDENLADLPPGQLAENLRELDTPYNTYLYPGLPPSAIGNPGRVAIEAVLRSPQTEYLYYITGDDGQFYYSETYNEHLRNIDRYLR